MKETRKTILIVDDQPNWRNLLAELLDSEYEVTCVETAVDALAALWQQVPSFFVAIVDIRLDDKDPQNESGLELVEELNRRGEYTHAIVVTGYPTVGTAKKALRTLNAFEYLLKYPENGRAFDHKEFEKIVHEAAEDAERRRRKDPPEPEEKLLLDKLIEIDQVKLLQNLIDFFNESELTKLCFDLKIDYESLGGHGKADKARELVAYCERRGRLSELINKCRELRPHVSW